MNSVILVPIGNLYLILGVVLFCVGTLLGIPHGSSKRRGDLKRTELWRVAHLSTCVGGVSLIGLTLALERLFADAAFYTLVPFSLAAYGFCIACTLSGWLNKSWDEDRTQRSVTLIYRLQILASLLSIVGIGAFVMTLIVKVWV